MKTFFTTLLLLAATRFAPAQDIVYLNNQTKVTGELLDLTPEKVSLSVEKGSSKVKFSYGADRVVLIVSKWGHLLCMNYVLTQPADEQGRLISQFMENTTLPPSDIIIRLSPMEVIRGEIAYDQGDVINYTTPVDGTLASLPKSKIAAVFYRTGKHEIFADAPTLCDTPNLLGDRENTAVKVPAPTPAPKVAATPADNGTRPAPPGSGTTLKLTDQEYVEYRSQGLQRVQQFGTFLGIMADKTADANEKARVTREIMRLFKPDATIEVSSAVRGGPPVTYTIADYLRRLRLLSYKSVSLEWTDIQYVQEFTQKADGNYYGKIRGEQRFSGLNTSSEVQYGDITQKEVDVMLTPYQKSVESDTKQKWFILLGNVGVVATQ